MKFIKLTKGKNTKIDGNLFDDISKHKWLFDGNYAARWEYEPNKKKIYLHRYIMGEEYQEIDHINRDKLDNRKENLRACNRSSNCINKPCKGDVNNRRNIHWYKGAYVVQIKRDNKLNYLGRFKNISDAVKKRDEFERSIYA